MLSGDWRQVEYILYKFQVINKNSLKTEQKIECDILDKLTQVRS